MVHFANFPSVLIFTVAMVTCLQQVSGFDPHRDCKSIPRDCLMTDALQYHIACKSRSKVSQVRHAIEQTHLYLPETAKKWTAYFGFTALMRYKQTSCSEEGYNVGICTADATCMMYMTKYRCDCYQHGILMVSFVRPVKPY